MKLNIEIARNIKGLIGLTSVALLLPVSAIEKPAEQEGPKQKENKAAVADEAPKPVQKTAMLGVGGMTASETLSLHLGLEQGNGLTLYHILPGSAADKAGLKEHDILTEFDGKKIGKQEDLRAAVQEKNPGDEVTLKLISRGKAQEKKVILGERKDMPGAVPAPGIDPEWLQKNLGGNIPPAEVLPMEKEMLKRLRDMQKQLQQQMPQGQGGPMKLELGKLLKDAKKGGVRGFGIGTSITLMDNDGSITMKTNNGKKEVIVKNKAGEILFEGPYQTEQDKAAVPEDIRERIDRLKMGGAGNGLKLRIMPPMNMPPAEEAEEEPAQ